MTPCQSDNNCWTRTPSDYISLATLISCLNIRQLRDCQLEKILCRLCACNCDRRRIDVCRHWRFAHSTFRFSSSLQSVTTMISSQKPGSVSEATSTAAATTAAYISVQTSSSSNTAMQSGVAPEVLSIPKTFLVFALVAVSVGAVSNGFVLFALLRQKMRRGKAVNVSYLSTDLYPPAHENSILSC